MEKENNVDTVITETVNLYLKDYMIAYENLILFVNILDITQQEKQLIKNLVAEMIIKHRKWCEL
jgi:hypothetical protein